MIPLRPLANLHTHDVANMPPHLGDQDLWRADAALRQGVARKGGGWAEEKLAAFGKIAGAAEIFEKADAANRHIPEIKPFDRYGMRINQVEFHPAYHDLMAVAIENEVPSFAWRHPGPGSQVGHAALSYMFNGKVLFRCQPLRFEAPHLTGRGGTTIKALAVDDGSHRRVERQSLGIVDILVSGQAAIDRLPQQARQQVARILAAPQVRQRRATEVGQAENIVQLAVGQ